MLRCPGLPARNRVEPYCGPRLGKFVSDREIPERYGNSVRRGEQILRKFRDSREVGARIPSKRPKSNSPIVAPRSSRPEAGMRDGPLRNTNPAGAGGKLFSSFFRPAPHFGPKILPIRKNRKSDDEKITPRRNTSTYFRTNHHILFLRWKMQLLRSSVPPLLEDFCLHVSP